MQRSWAYSQSCWLIRGCCGSGIARLHEARLLDQTRGFPHERNRRKSDFGGFNRLVRCGERARCPRARPWSALPGLTDSFDIHTSFIPRNMQASISYCTVCDTLSNPSFKATSSGFPVSRCWGPPVREEHAPPVAAARLEAPRWRTSSGPLRHRARYRHVPSTQSAASRDR